MTIVVTVVLPSVPVMATSGRCVPAGGQVELRQHRHAGPVGGRERRVAVGHPGARQERVGAGQHRGQVLLGRRLQHAPLRAMLPQPGRSSEGWSSTTVDARCRGRASAGTTARPVTPRPMTTTEASGEVVGDRVGHQSSTPGRLTKSA